LRLLKEREERLILLELRKNREVYSFQRASQGEIFDEMGVPWYKDKHVGALPVSPDKCGGEGKWYREHGGRVRPSNFASDNA
jgi:hypothetical protein